MIRVKLLDKDGVVRYVNVKATKCAGAMALIIASTGVSADPPGKETREAWKEQMEYQRGQTKRDREWEREQRKRYEELEREEWKRQNVGDLSEQEYIEDKTHRVVKILRNLSDIVQ